MSSVKFDSTEILDTTHIPRFVQHESAPDRVLMDVALARQDGEVLIYERYDMKVIRLQGMLVGTSASDLESKIDAFKELFSRAEKNLDISWAGSTRRYVATCSRHQLPRDHYNITSIPWTAEFIVSSGLGYDIAATTPIDAVDITTAEDGGDGDFIYEGSFTMSGSRAAAPIITLEFGDTVDGAMLGLEFINIDTGDRIIVTRNGDWSGATVIIDCLNKRVLHNIGNTDEDPTEQSFFGIFPAFSIGTNNFRIRSGGIINQRTSEDSVPAAGDPASFFRIGANANDEYAMSFQVPYSDDTFAPLKIGVAEESTPPTEHFYVRIWPDIGGVPDTSGSPIAVWQVEPEDISAVYPSYEYLMTTNIVDGDDPFALRPNTPYWLVFVPATTEANPYYLNISSTVSYPRGSALLTTDAESTWTPNGPIPPFRLLFGGASKATDITLTVEYTKTYL